MKHRLGRQGDKCRGVYPWTQQKSGQGRASQEKYEKRIKKKWWLNPDLNWGHADFQSAALPTELFSHPMSCDKGGIQRFGPRFDKPEMDLRLVLSPGLR